MQNDQENDEGEMGDDNTVIGKPPKKLGSRNVIINAADAKGNVVLNQPGAYGTDASAGPGSIAVGARANAGGKSRTIQIITQINAIVGNQQSQDLFTEAQQTSPDRTRIKALWNGLKKSGALKGHGTLIQQLDQALGQ